MSTISRTYLDDRVSLAHTAAGTIEGPEPVHVGRKVREGVVARACLDATELAHNLFGACGEDPGSLIEASRQVAKYAALVAELEDGCVGMPTSVAMMKALIEDERQMLASDIGELETAEGGADEDRRWRETESRRLVAQARQLRVVWLDCHRFEAEQQAAWPSAG